MGRYRPFEAVRKGSLFFYRTRFLNVFEPQVDAIRRSQHQIGKESLFLFEERNNLLPSQKEFANRGWRPDSAGVDVILPHLQSAETK